MWLNSLIKCGTLVSFESENDPTYYMPQQYYKHIAQKRCGMLNTIPN